MFTASCPFDRENAQVAIKKHLCGAYRWSFDGYVKAKKTKVGLGWKASLRRKSPFRGRR
nr:MAG TPA: hypothetical protein [Caudoviricetes sp.]